MLYLRLSQPSRRPQNRLEETVPSSWPPVTSRTSWSTQTCSNASHAQPAWPNPAHLQVLNTTTLDCASQFCTSYPDCA